MEAQKQGLSRRGFLKGAALSALGAGVAGAGLVGCAPTPAQESPASNAPAATGNLTPQTVFAQLNPQDYSYTGNTTDFATLFSEVKIGSLSLSHRMVKSAGGSDTHNNEEEIIAYYRNFAKGGIDLVWMEDNTDTFPHFPMARKQSLEKMPLARIAEAVHAEGAYIGYQLSCMGAVFSGTPQIAEGTFASAVAGDLSKTELADIIADFIAAAKIFQDAGFDAVEINAAGNNLGQSFLSRMRNHRDDDYGPQSFENRARFVTDIIKGIKQTCGADFVVQVLINGIEENDTNLGDSSLMTTVEENLELSKLFEAAGADSLHVRLGPLGMHIAQFASDLYFTGIGINGTTGYGNQFDFSRHWEGKLASAHSGCGMMLNVAKEYKSAVSIPVGTVTYMDPAHAPDYFENALKEGKADFLLMNRPLTVDFDYPTKLKEGRLDEIAPCTRCMHCHFDYDRDGKVYEHCRVNACTQRAYRAEMPEGYELPAASGQKKVMVIGGGPAGMEAARIAAQRGYTVSLFEKNPSVGGLLEFASLVKGPHENLDALRSYLARQLELTGVTVTTGKEVDAAFIAEQAPDVVVLAAGGKRGSLGLSATAGTKIVPITDVLTAELGESITVVGANAQAVDVALYLIALGKHVSMVFPDVLADLDKGQSSWVKAFVKPMLFARGVRMFPQGEIVSVGDGEISIKGETGVDIPIKCDAIIEAMDMLPNKELIDSLSGITTYTIGDCDDPWNIAEAITSGNLTGRAL
ncbi:MAG: FAD-dependent oxidoreductase [Coriobacteriales bacterium]|jgi:2,4-dienoyl-CoA reductase-like NADH-dependent reductase (Old Yellow Enzyme family)/thioredoxin reductase|nr:FAD-dependent oxidoreductase [Coriobacteriales bacterium]